MRIDPARAALYALVAVCLVATGAVLTSPLDALTVEQRGAAMGGVVAVLVGVYYLARRDHTNGDAG